MAKKALWYDPESEEMGEIPFSRLREWLRTARQDLVIQIGDARCSVLTWINDPEMLSSSIGDGPSILRRTYNASISFRKIAEGGYKSGKVIAQFIYFMSPAVVTEGTIYSAQTVYKPLKRLASWRPQRRSAAIAAVPPRQIEAGVVKTVCL